jgi:hypothetical protein
MKRRFFAIASRKKAYFGKMTRQSFFKPCLVIWMESCVFIGCRTGNKGGRICCFSK